MDNQRMAFGVSFLIHAAAATLFLSMGHFVVQKPIVIDFSINGDSQEAGGSGPQSQKAEDEPQPVKPIAGQREAAREKPAEVPVPSAEAKEQVQEESPVSVAVQEVPVQTTAVAANIEISPLPVGDDIGEGDSRSQLQGGSRTGDATGPGRNGDGLENAKNLYLKEHFAYIRDSIMKKVSYPYIARKRGLTGKVVVSFVVCERGFANDIKIVESSGYSILDNNAIETIKKASPFPKPPIRAELVMPMVYKIL